MRANNQSVSNQTESWCLERVSGPHLGHYFGGYSRQSPGGYIAYVKIFDHEPDSVWDGTARAKVTAHGARSYGSALTLAESRAMAWIERVKGPQDIHHD